MEGLSNDVIRLIFQYLTRQCDYCAFAACCKRMKSIRDNDKTGSTFLVCFRIGKVTHLCHDCFYIRCLGFYISAFWECTGAYYDQHGEYYWGPSMSTRTRIDYATISTAHPHFLYPCDDPFDDRFGYQMLLPIGEKQMDRFHQEVNATFSFIWRHGHDNGIQLEILRDRARIKLDAQMLLEEESARPRNSAIMWIKRRLFGI